MAPNPLRNLVFSVIRTLVPAGVTLAIGWLTENFGVVISENSKAEAVAIAYTVAFGLYYFVVRILEVYVTPKFSFLLGDFRKGHTDPVYADPDQPTVVPPTSDTP